MDGRYLPTTGRIGKQEFDEHRIRGAKFFDIHHSFSEEGPFPHTLPTPSRFWKEVSKLGIGKEDSIVAYDGVRLNRITMK